MVKSVREVGVPNFGTIKTHVLFIVLVSQNNFYATIWTSGMITVRATRGNAPQYDTTVCSPTCTVDSDKSTKNSTGRLPFKLQLTLRPFVSHTGFTWALVDVKIKFKLNLVGRPTVNASDQILDTFVRKKMSKFQISGINSDLLNLSRNVQRAAVFHDRKFLLQQLNISGSSHHI